MTNDYNEYTMSVSSFDGDFSIDYNLEDVSYANLLDLTPTLRCFKVFPEAHLPEYGTDQAACFDLKASLQDGDTVTVYSAVNNKEKRTVENNSLTLYHGERMLVPTGCIFDLESNTSLRIHPRSGLSLKSGVVIANCEGIVDADYVEQTYVMLHNISDKPFKVNDADRIAQGEVVSYTRRNIVETTTRPAQKTDRDGGLGSTGV